MRSRFVKIAPDAMSARLRGVSLELGGAYLALLLAYFRHPDDGGPMRVRIDDGRAIKLVLGDPRSGRRLLAELLDRGLVTRDECGALRPVDYSPTAWVRRAASSIEYEFLVQRDGEHCRSCASTDHLSVDHIKPVAAEGSDLFSNLQLLCRSCNSKKGGRA